MLILSPIEAKILARLRRAGGRYVSRVDLADAVYGDPNKVAALSSAVARLRRKGVEIETFESAGDRWVAMRRICENLGMDWASQSVKLGKQKEKFARCDITTHDSSGRSQEMVAIPTRKLALWLACINPNKVAAHVRRAPTLASQT